MKGKQLTNSGSKKLYKKTVGKINKVNLGFQKQNTRGGTRF